MSLKVEFVDNSASQYDGNACSLKLSHKPSKGKLFVGDQSSMSFVQIKHRNIRAVLCCHPDLYGYCKESGVAYHKVYPTEEFVAKDVSKRDQSLQFITEQLAKGHNVLVACQNGLTGSAVVAIAYLMQYQDYSLIDAYQHVQSRRGQNLKVSLAMATMLLVMEKLLFQANTMQLEERKLVAKTDLSSTNVNESKGEKGSSPKSGSVSGSTIAIGVVAAIAVMYGCLYLATGKL
jgi:hypothetical protein